MPTNPVLIKLMSDVHKFWYQVTGGIIGGNVMGRPILMLTTTGRKSGEPRTAPLLFLRDDGRYVVIASFGGNDQHPAWWLNLKRHPEAEVRVGRERHRVLAEAATGDERERLWSAVVEMYPNYAEYQENTSRQIPVVVLRPQEGAP